MTIKYKYIYQLKWNSGHFAHEKNLSPLFVFTLKNHLSTQNKKHQHKQLQLDM